MYQKKFEIRWSDLDPNWHLANSAYMNFMSHTRMAFMLENGLGQKELSEYNLGAVVFYEHIYYFKELLPGHPVTVTLQVKGLSEDGMFFEFVHNLYGKDNVNSARCIMLGAWMDTRTRKLTALPEALNGKLSLLSKTDDFRILTKEDTREHGQVPASPLTV